MVIKQTLAVLVLLSSSALAAPLPKEPLEVAADDILARFDANIFRGRIVRLQGRVSDLSGDVVVMEGRRSPGQIYVRFLKGWFPPPGFLVHGQDLFVNCRRTGLAIGRPYFHDCVIIDPS